MRITPGRVAWYVTGRFYLDEQGKLQDLGYFLHLEGVQGALFNQGATGEATARLTFRSEPFEAQSVSEWNPSDSMLMAPVAYPATILASATARLRKRTMTSTRVTAAYRAEPGPGAGGLIASGGATRLLPLSNPCSL